MLRESIDRIKLSYFKKYDAEKHELYQIIKSLKDQLSGAKGEEPDKDGITHTVSMPSQGK